LGSAEGVSGNIIKEKGRSGELDLLDENTGPDDDATIKIVTFSLGKEEYGIPISQVQEVNRVGEITRVPNVPEYVLGVINLRGKIIPVIELSNILQFAKSKIDKQSRIVIFENGQKLLGLLVDWVSQVINISREQIEEAPDQVTVDQSYIDGIVKLDEKRLVILLDLRPILNGPS
jgi:purine-binding chemotaxis protein CheW